MLTYIKNIIAYCLLLTVVSLSTSAYTQPLGRVNNYTVTRINGGPMIFSGTSLITTNNTAATVALPFAFSFDSVLYPAGTRLYIGTNGWIIFGDSSASPSSSIDEVGQSGYAPAILFFSGHVQNFGSGFGYILTGVSGTAPNRIFTIEDYKFGLFNPNVNATIADIRLYESTSVIEFVYRDHATVLGTGSAGVGLNGAALPNFVFQRVDTASNMTPATDLRFTPGNAVAPSNRRLVVSPSFLNFDSVRIGDTLCKTVLIKNIGTDTVRILKNYRAGVADPDFVFTPIAHADTVLLPNAQLPFNVCFSPVQRGTRVAGYRFNTDIPLTNEVIPRDTSKIPFTVIGVGIPSPHLIGSFSRIDSVAIGKQDCITDTIKNNGTSDFVILKAQLNGGDSSEFLLNTWTFPTYLKPGDMLLFTRCVTPSKHGLRSTTLSLSGTTEGRSINIPLVLRGFGMEQCATIVPSALFDRATPVGTSQTDTIEVSNCGEIVTSYALAIPSGNPVYSIVGATSSTAMRGGSTASFIVTFTPTKIGSAHDTLVVSGSGGLTSVKIPLNGLGTGVLLASIDTTISCRVKDSAFFDIRIVNNGNVDWTAGAGVIGGGTNPADFDLIGLPQPAIILRNGGTAAQRIRFHPTHVGAETSVLTYPVGAPQSLNAFAIVLRGNGTTTGAVATLAAQNGYELYQSFPNPSKPFTNISFYSPELARLEFSILDVTGKTVKALPAQQFEKGTHAFKIDCSDLASGTYVYQLTNGVVRLERQMVVAR
jgi:hypothetical protein